MFYGNPRIYNGDGIYNGGGGDGSFEIELNGTKTNAVFPPYLIPVEYIDTKDFLESTNFCIEIPEQIDVSQLSNFECVCKFKLTGTLVNSTPAYVISMYPNDEITNNVDFRTSVYTKPGYNSVLIACGFCSKSFPNVDLSKDIIVKFTSSNKNFQLIEIDGSQYNYTDTRNLLTKNLSQANIFNEKFAINGVFKGRFFYSFISNDDKVSSLIIPARAKDVNDKKIYMVECVSGSVGINFSSNIITSGAIFGPDIDLDNVQQYFE